MDEQKYQQWNIQLGYYIMTTNIKLFILVFHIKNKCIQPWLSKTIAKYLTYDVYNIVTIYINQLNTKCRLNNTCTL